MILGAHIFSLELENDGDDHAVEAEHFCEDEDQDQCDKDILVHGEALNTLLTDEADRVPRRKLRQSARQTST